MQGMIGEIRLFGGNFTPRSWASCDGQLLSISQNSALFSILGTTYGGDGRTTFALPDLRGRSALGEGNGAGLTDRRLGSKGGTTTNTLTVAQLPNHGHSLVLQATPKALIPVSISAADENSPNETYLTTQTNEFYSSAATAGQFYGENAIPFNPTIIVGNTGGQQAINNQQPFLVVRYIICMQGLFPSRN
ncbi:MAG: tail fiber protein [Bacteroidota bacterium]